MEKIQRERAGAIALNRIFGLEPTIARAVTETLDDSAEIFGMSRRDIDSVFGPFSKHRHKITPQALDDAFRELEWLQERGYGFISIRESCFPERLRDCPDAPVGLYIRSSTPPEELFNGIPVLAVVGTRDPSPYGLDWCNRIVAAVGATERPPVIVSGLALGIDICAHMSALGHGLKTIAVLPTSIDEIYPRRHGVAAGKIASTPGCALISDFPPGTPAQPFTFLRRNRIIAGLADATVLVESRRRGGGTITTGLAAGYGRDVYALPGRIDDPRSEGCNRIISEKSAECIYDLDSLVRSLGLGAVPAKSGTGLHEFLLRTYPDSGSDRLVLMAETIGKNRGIDIDGLCRKLGMEFSEAAALCNRLECDGIIEMDLLQRCTVKKC